MNALRSAAASVAFVSLFHVAAAQNESARASEMSFRDVYWDTLDANGRLTGGKTQMFVPDRHAVRGAIPASCVPLVQLAALPPNPANRVHMVFVGDGYTAAQL